MKPPIYEPAGKAKEYGDLAINIYTGCPHACYFCFAPNVLHKTRDAFSMNVQPREGIVDAVRKQLEKEKIVGKLIHLCFTCDPFPIGVDTTATRLIIRLIKDSGNNVQILTKNGAGALRDLDLLDSNDWVGVTYAGYTSSPVSCPPEEPNAGWPLDRLRLLVTAKSMGINTWMSCEPVLDPDSVFKIIETGDYIDLFKIGKLNYYPSNIDWSWFGNRAEELCKKYHRNYYLKDGLRAAMGRP